jgi:hypothetical protein
MRDPVDVISDDRSAGLPLAFEYVPQELRVCVQYIIALLVPQYLEVLEDISDVDGVNGRQVSKLLHRYRLRLVDQYV